MEAIATEHGWSLNPNPNQVIALIKAENMLQEKFGHYYCPCKIKRIPENVCPCQDAQAEIDRDGHCHCKMFFKNK